QRHDPGRSVDRCHQQWSGLAQCILVLPASHQGRDYRWSGLAGQEQEVMRRSGGLVAAAVFAGIVLHGCAGGRKGPVVGVSLLNVSNEFIVMLNKSMDAKAKELGVELIVNDAQRSAERQVQQVESFVAQKVDAIILNPCEVDASSPAVDRAIAAGIPIVNVNSETRS